MKYPTLAPTSIESHKEWSNPLLLKLRLKFSSLDPDQKNLLLLTGAALLLAIAGLDNVALRDFDEGYYATTGQDTYLRGDWRFPTYLGQPFLSKPPLITWLLMVSYHLLGVSEFSSRLPLALISALAVPLLYLVGREIFSSPKAALWSGTILLTLLPTARLGRLTMLDGVINTFLLWSLFCLLKGRKNPRWLGGIGIGLGLIALSKGLIVVVLGGLLGILALWLGEWRILQRWQFWLGLRSVSPLWSGGMGYSLPSTAKLFGKYILSSTVLSE